ncbi:MAG TPA: hypothetical protein VER11_07785 [Polyangiaceae bacterium]|nr:hypothetical protein [Polyangiaceae bacterium]
MKLNWWVTLGVLVLGCGGSDGGGSTSAASKKCVDFQESFCGLGASCIAELGCDPGFSRDDEYNACMSGIRSTLNCDRAVSVAASYDQCMTDIVALPCSAFGTSAQCMAPSIPTSCNKVILLSP